MIDFPNNPVQGQVFAAGGTLYTYNGQGWITTGVAESGGQGFPVIIADTPPPLTSTGFLWWESDKGALYILYDDGNSSQWVQINATPPGADTGGGIDVATADERYVNSAGDTMVGPLTISGQEGGVAANVWATGPGGPWFGAYDTTVTGEPGFWLGRTGYDRWGIVLSNFQETGGNAGSGLRIIRYSDTGVQLGDAINIDRASGLTTVAGDPAVGLGIATKQYADAGDASSRAYTDAVNNSIRNDSAAAYVNATGDSMSGALTVNADIYANRSANEGVIFLGSSGQHYLYWNGTTYNLPAGRLTLGAYAAGGLDAVALDQLNSAVSSLTNQINAKQNNLGFTPVQQNGGIGHAGNKVYIGWSGSGLKCTVDSSDQGTFMFGSGGLVGGGRLVMAGDIQYSQINASEGMANGVATGSSAVVYGYIIVRYRYLQMLMDGNWNTVGYA